MELLSFKKGKTGTGEQGEMGGRRQQTKTNKTSKAHPLRVPCRSAEAKVLLRGLLFMFHSSIKS